jgi:hypothetical protein
VGDIHPVKRVLNRPSRKGQSNLSESAGFQALPSVKELNFAFPFLLALDGYPTPPADFAQGQWFSFGKQSNSRAKKSFIRAQSSFSQFFTDLAIIS